MCCAWRRGRNVRTSDTHWSLDRAVDDADEVVRLHHALAPRGIELGCWLGGDYFDERAAARLQLLHAIADGDEHVPIRGQSRLVRQRSVAWDDLRRVVGQLEG